MKRVFQIVFAAVAFASSIVAILTYFEERDVIAPLVGDLADRVIVQTQVNSGGAADGKFIDPEVAGANDEEEKHSELVQKPVRPPLDRVQEPVRELFRAWSDLDFDLYMAQWDFEARQIYPNSTRSYEDIYAKRKSAFNRLQSVNVHKLAVCHYGSDDDEQILFATYSLEFRYRTGRIYREDDIRESYRVRYNDVLDRWLIVENRDYLTAAPC